MNIYSLAIPLLFQFDAEASHDFTLKSLKTAERLGALKSVSYTHLDVYKRQILFRPKVMVF